MAASGWAPEQRLQLVEAVGAAGCWGDVDIPAASVEVEQTEETEWHAVFFLTAPAGLQPPPMHAKLVVNVPSWQGAALSNKAIASRHVADLGLAPSVLADFEAVIGSDSRRVHVCAWLDGGQLQPAELEDSAVLAELGALYGRLHHASAAGTGTGTAWFETTAAGLRAEGAVASDDPGDWASCSWVLTWLMSLVPEANRTALASQGVDWDFLASEIAGLRTSALLPETAVGTVHGDSHMGNLIRDSDGKLKLIDFDLTAPGPAGSEFGFVVLMLFRCGFAPDMVLSRELQHAFAAGYLGVSAPLGVTTEADTESLLLTMHLWGYFGMLKMGLLCAVLMENAGHEQKRQVMKLRGPQLLSKDFLEVAKECMAVRNPQHAYSPRPPSPHELERPERSVACLSIGLFLAGECVHSCYHASGSSIRIGPDKRNVDWCYVLNRQH